MDISIASYSFHRLLENGKQDIFGYIADCKRLGCTLLDPWTGHLASLDVEPKKFEYSTYENLTGAEQKALPTAGYDVELSADEQAFIGKIKAASDAAGLPFGCLAADGAHIYDEDSAARLTNRAKAIRWMKIAQMLGARQIRIDAGGTPEMPNGEFLVITLGYHDLLAQAKAHGLQLLMENHWGASKIPDNVVRIMDAASGLKLLFDTNNWAEGMREEGWQKCAKYAGAVHIKTHTFDENGNEPSVNLAKAIRCLLDSGYTGCWGVESVPKDGDEYGAAEKTIALIRRLVH
jgi:sugar phosphate isomerase/epimerase